LTLEYTPGRIFEKNDTKMLSLKNSMCAVLLLCSLETHAQQASTLNWYSDVMKANEVSQTSGKPIFAFFTGSDWCPWCKKIQQDVFTKPGFIKWAQEHVVLLEVDFPRNKDQSQELENQNRFLQQAFQVQGFPTVVLFFLTKKPGDSKYTLESLGTLGYPGSTEKGREEIKFIEEANFILNKNRTQAK